MDLDPSLIYSSSQLKVGLAAGLRKYKQWQLFDKAV